MKLPDWTFYLTVAALLCLGGIAVVNQSTLKAEVEMAIEISESDIYQTFREREKELREQARPDEKVKVIHGVPTLVKKNGLDLHISRVRGAAI